MHRDEFIKKYPKYQNEWKGSNRIEHWEMFRNLLLLINVNELPISSQRLTYKEVYIF